MEATAAIPEPESRAATPSGYVLVILRSGENANLHRVHDAAHRAFIDGLIKQNRILLGGAFGAPAGDAEAAYVLRSSSVDEARAIVTADPLVRHGVCRADCVEWQLVGINPDAIDDAVIVRPRDIA